MNNNNWPNLLFVINPGAGSNNIEWKEIILKHFETKDYNVDFHMLDSIPDILKLQKHINSNDFNQVIAVGGDGTVTMVARLIAGSKVALGILPGGSANGMAKELNIPVDYFAALSIIETGKVKSCDMIRINGNETCLHLSDIGLNAQLIKYFDEGKVRGMLGYARVLLKTLFHKRKIRLTIQEKDKQTLRVAFMVVLANASKYGTGAVINPEGSLHDGFFEVVVVKRLAFRELIKMLLKPQPFNPRNIETFHAKKVSIETHRYVHFQIDGEYKGKVKKVEAEILPGSINIMLPG